jgi:hypothetical protein
VVARCPSWDSYIAILPGECLALVNIDRQVHGFARKLAAAYVVKSLAASHEWPAPLATLASAPTLN